MSTQTVTQSSTNVRQAIVRFRWTIVLGLLSMVTALATYRFSSVPAPSPTMERAQASLVEPAQQSVLDYLRVHSSVQLLATPAAPLDPAQQSVMSYVRAHESVVPSPAPWDPAVQAVLDYFQVHSR
jgi:hypothetical protein